MREKAAHDANVPNETPGHGRSWGPPRRKGPVTALQESGFVGEGDGVANGGRTSLLVVTDDEQRMRRQSVRATRYGEMPTVSYCPIA